MARKKTSRQTSKWTDDLKSKVLIVLLPIFFLLAQSAFWLNHTIFNQQSFTDKTTDVLTSQSSRDAVANGIVTRAFADKPVAQRVLGERATSLISGLLDTDLSHNAINKVATKFYSYSTSSDREDVAIDLTAIKTPITAVVAVAENQGREVQFDPAAIPDEVVLIESEEFPDFSKSVQAALWLAPLFWLGTLLTLGLYIYFGQDNYAKRVYVAGFVLIGACLLALLTGPFMPPAIASLVSGIGARTIVQDLAEAFLSPFVSQLLIALTTIVIALIIFNQRFNILSLANRTVQRVRK